MKFKKFFCVISLLLVLSLIFTACGKDKDEKDENTSSGVTDTEITSDSADNEETESTEKKEKKKTEKEKETTAEKTDESDSEDEKTEDTSESKKTGKNESQSSPKDMSFFDDVVFIGDSVTLGLKNYVVAERNKGNECLGNAQFLTAGSMGYVNSRLKIGAENSVHPKYKGETVYIEDGVERIGAKKAFIMLGLNDFCVNSLDDGMKGAKQCIQKIIDKNPGIKIYVQSVTPTAINHLRFNNDNIDAFNNGLKKLCKENDWEYVDVSSAMKNSNGDLVESYCSDMEGKGVHMSREGCIAWLNYLYETYC